MDTAHSNPRRRTLAEMTEVIADFDRSDLTQKAFAARHHIPIATFAYWLRKVRAQQTDSRPVFLSVETSKPQPEAPFELIAPNGWTLRLTQPLNDSRALQPLLQLIAQQPCSR